MKYYTCQNCGSNLDLGERCNCLYPEIKHCTKDGIVVEALEWTGRNYADMECLLLHSHFYYDFNRVEGGLVLRTREKDCPVQIGQYILKIKTDTYDVCNLKDLKEIL